MDELFKGLEAQAPHVEGTGAERFRQLMQLSAQWKLARVDSALASIPLLYKPENLELRHGHFDSWTARMRHLFLLLVEIGHDDGSLAVDDPGATVDVVLAMMVDGSARLTDRPFASDTEDEYLQILTTGLPALSTATERVLGAAPGTFAIPGDFTEWWSPPSGWSSACWRPWRPPVRPPASRDGRPPPRVRPLMSERQRASKDRPCAATQWEARPGLVQRPRTPQPLTAVRLTSTPTKGTAMARPNPLADRVRDLLPGGYAVREVTMFGGRAFMLDEAMSVSAGNDGDLLVRVDPDRHDEVLERPGARQAFMGADRTMGPGWVTVGADALASDDDLRAWIHLALEHRLH